MMTFKVFGIHDWNNRMHKYVDGEACRGAGLGYVVCVILKLYFQYVTVQMCILF